MQYLLKSGDAVCDTVDPCSSLGWSIFALVLWQYFYVTVLHYVSTCIARPATAARMYKGSYNLLPFHRFHPALATFTFAPADLSTVTEEYNRTLLQPTGRKEITAKRGRESVVCVCVCAPARKTRKWSQKLFGKWFWRLSKKLCTRGTRKYLVLLVPHWENKINGKFESTFKLLWSQKRDLG
jgi:hypothetical protein